MPRGCLVIWLYTLSEFNQADKLTDIGASMAKILVVEDIPENAELTKRVLVSAGFEVMHAFDAAEGFNLALTRDPDLIILDLGLPDYDGQTLAGWLLANPKTADIPIVVLTAWPEETGRSMAESYGCVGFIAKPITNVRDFASKIDSYIKTA